MKIVLKVGGARADWWKDHMAGLLPEYEVILAEEVVDKDIIDFAVVWLPEPGWLKSFPNLKCIFSIGSGIDHILKDKELPQHLPIVRLTGTDLSTRMREYVVLHVLRLHRRLPEVEESQKTEEWNQIIEPPANNRTVGIMGLGNLGADCAQILSKIGFNVLGWAKSKKSLEGVESFVGNSGFDTFLSKSDIVVCMLPLTPETKDIMNASFFKKMKNGASIINVARGPHLNEEDLLVAIKSKKIRSATLDVFHNEPLEKGHPFWKHPNVLVTPHIASLIDPVAGGKAIADNIKNFVLGNTINELIPPGKNY
ncbi:MAG: glyoxylate/hydroxypyruvate reductase A [Rhodobacteraceae bacterium]|nr:glyoxylate/hydroxypyruvate reductase A [Paracoccaceae bacterium]